MAVNINNVLMEFNNVYAPNMRQTARGLSSHTPLNDCFVVGDFNCHHAMWYSDAAVDKHDSIRNSVRAVTAIIDWCQTHRQSLLNTSAIFTHFPHSGHKPSIVDLIFPSGKVGEMVQEWSCDAKGGASCDHIPAYTLLSTCLMTFNPRLLHHKTNQELF